MFEFVRTHQRLMQFMLLLLIFPSFAFFGLQSYMNFRDGGDAVAKVGKDSISKQQFDAAYREQLDRMRAAMGQNFDPKLFDTPEARQEVLDKLITERVTSVEAKKENLWASNYDVQQAILSLPGMVDADGHFDPAHYAAFLQAQGMSKQTLDENLRHELTQRQVGAAIQSTGFVPKSISYQISDFANQVRDVQELILKPADFSAQVKVTDDTLKAYYDKHPAQFETLEQAKIEYVVLDFNAIASQIPVSDADIKSYYDNNVKQQFTTVEQRRASHILIALKRGATSAESDAAKAKAEKLLEQLRKKPADFAKLAKENSNDPGSKERGGDVGYFESGKGIMVKPFEDAVFQMKEGQISDLVQSEFGYHIIQLTAIKPSTVKPLEEVKDKITAEIRKQQASKKFPEFAETFTNTVYEQSDSLKPVADKLGLKIETAAELTRKPNAALPAKAPYNNPKFLTALFAEDVLKNKHNTDAVEVAPSVLIAARVTEYKPSVKRPLDEVKDAVRQLVAKEESEKLAEKAGKEKLAALRAKDDTSGFGAAKTISRMNGQDVDGAALTEVMKADTTKLPSYVGVNLPGKGYGIYRIVKVSLPATMDKAQRETERHQIDGMVAQQELIAYMEALKQKAKVKILQPLPASGESGDGGQGK